MPFRLTPNPSKWPSKAAFGPGLINYKCTEAKPMKVMAKNDGALISAVVAN
jgi:hypothetical protein